MCQLLLSLHFVNVGKVPFTWTDPACSAETYVLAPPSEHPSNRRDALAVRAFLDELIQNPPQAFEMYALLVNRSPLCSANHFHCLTVCLSCHERGVKTHDSSLPLHRDDCTAFVCMFLLLQASTVGVSHHVLYKACTHVNLIRVACRQEQFLINVRALHHSTNKHVSMNPGLQAGEQPWWLQVMLNLVCQALMQALYGQVLWHARHHQPTELPTNYSPIVQPGVLVPHTVRACANMCLATHKCHPSTSAMLLLRGALPATVCLAPDDTYEIDANLKLVQPYILLCMLCSLGRILYAGTNHVSTELSSSICAVIMYPVHHFTLQDHHQQLLREQRCFMCCMLYG